MSVNAQKHMTSSDEIVLKPHGSKKKNLKRIFFKDFELNEKKYKICEMQK